MTANVRCAGGGTVARDRAPFGLGPTHYERATNGEPCGWTGQRYAYLKPGRNDRWADPTLVPCPRCGGRVELIPEEHAS